MRSEPSGGAGIVIECGEIEPREGPIQSFGVPRETANPELDREAPTGLRTAGMGAK
jgi:hypothetical protein